MFLLPVLLPFSRLGRASYVLAIILLFAIAAAGLVVLRHGEIYSELGKLLFYPALWGLVMAMVNRTRDARASPGWVLTPVILTGAAVLALLKSFAGAAPQADAITGRTSPAEVVNWFVVYGAWLWMAALASAFLWLTSIVMLATFPSRPPPPRNRWRLR